MQIPLRSTICTGYLRVEPVEEVKYEGAVLSEALKRIGMKIVMPYGRKYAKRGMVRVCDDQA
jgi:hypothetical protein